MQRQNKMALVGISDHRNASASSSPFPKPIQQTELSFQRIRASRLVTSHDGCRHLVLSRFKTVVLLVLDATLFGQSLRSLAGTFCPDDKLSQTFMDVFAPEATGAVLKRCNPLWRSSCWLQSRHAGSSFSQDETMLCKYICHLKESGASSTTSSQLVEARRFADDLMRFTQARSQERLSAKVAEVAHSIFMTKRVTEPAEILTETEISELERTCLNDDALHRSVIAGHLLFCFAAAARWHDSMYVAALESSRAGDIFLLEALTPKHMSSRGKEQQVELLPFTALKRITPDGCWGQSWMDARQENHADTWNGFLCSWSESAHLWVELRKSTAEATVWLRYWLGPHAGADRSRKLTVQGLKATLLSWAAKSTLFNADEQLTLGHHVHAQHRSAIIYFRYNQIGHCKKLHHMFGKVMDGLFDPDATRVSCLFQLAYATMLESRGDDSDSDATTDSEASSVASSNGEHKDIAQRPGYKFLKVDDLEVELRLINSNSKVIHLLVSEYGKFWCGHASASCRETEKGDLAAT